MKAYYKRHFVAAQGQNEPRVEGRGKPLYKQNFKIELSKLPRPESGEIIRQLIKWSKGETLGKGDYKSFDKLYPGLGRWRIGDYRIYTYLLAGNIWVMLDVEKKLQNKLSDETKTRIVRRASIYEQNAKERDLGRYQRFLVQGGPNP